MLVLALLTACGPGPERLVVYVRPGSVDVFEAFTADLPWEHVEVVSSDDPEADADRGGRPTRVAIVPDLDCTDCYRIDEAKGGFVVHGDALGAQYGLAHLLEEMGFRFFHPYRTHAPEGLHEVDPAALGVLHEPEIARRGLHLHTLHPIEAYSAFWEPSEQNLAEAKQVIDWTIKNRGNYVQWVALDDISENASVREAWAAHTTAIVDYAHQRGITVGLGVQLFGRSNLQQAFDLLDDVGTPEEQRIAIDERLDQIDEIPWDVISLSFGEFFGEPPDAFLASTNLAYERMHATWPEAEVIATIHVGNFDDLRVDYNGENLQYYFLVKFADPAITPWVHTVMFYDLFEDAGGAYLHDEFDEHRDFLLDRLRNGQPVGYHPESAYWVTFDNSVPQYFPLYVRSRWVDLDQIRATAEAEGFPGLQDHVLFSTGWEWGYWQNDYATLRMNYETPADWRDVYRDMFAAHGEAGAELSDAILSLVDLQHGALIEARLAAYVAGRDSVMDFGYESLGIISQPDRPSYEDIVAMTPEARATFEIDVVDGLRALSVGTEAVGERVAAIGIADDPFFVEVADGIEVDRWRAAFAASIYGAIVAHGNGEDPQPLLEQARGELAQGRAAVTHRHGRWLDPSGDRWIRPEWDNAGIYDYGYLLRADKLCFWERELIQARNLALDERETVPGCAL